MWYLGFQMPRAWRVGPRVLTHATSGAAHGIRCRSANRDAGQKDLRPLRCWTVALLDYYVAGLLVGTPICE